MCDLALGTRTHGSCTLYYTWPMPQVSISISPFGNIGFSPPVERHTTLSRIGGGGETARPTRTFTWATPFPRQTKTNIDLSADLIHLRTEHAKPSTQKPDARDESP